MLDLAVANTGADIVIRPAAGVGIVFGIAFSSDGSSYVACPGDDLLQYETSTGSLVRAVPSGGRLDWTKRDLDFAYGIAVSPDGSFVAGGRGNGSVFLWKFGSDQRPLLLPGHERYVQCIRFSQAGDLLASGGHHQVGIWDFQQRKIKRWIKVTHFEDMAFSPGSKTIAVACGMGGAVLYDVETGSRIRDFVSGKDTRCVTFSRDGRAILSTDIVHEGQKTVGNIRIWDVSSGGVKAVLSGHTEIVEAVLALRDGRRAISASCDCTVRAWDLLAMKEIGRVSLPRTPAYSMALSADETTVLIGSIDKVALVSVNTILKRMDRTENSGKGTHNY
jgi:hypothetical protein